VPVTVLYDDKEQKWYTLSLKTFRIESTGQLYEGADQAPAVPAYGGYGGASVAPYVAPFIPYAPRNPQARLRVTFTALIPLPRVIDVTAGDMVTVRGSLPALGNWGQGVPLVMHAANEEFWYVNRITSIEIFGCIVVCPSLCVMCNRLSPKISTYGCLCGT
jgi:hypothetical protein